MPREKKNQTIIDQFLEMDKEKNYSKKKFKEIQSRHAPVGLNKKLKKAKLLNKRFKKKK